MKRLVKWFAKKYILSVVNDALSALAQKKDVEKYKAKTQQVVDACNLVLEVLKDNKVDSVEADAIVDAVNGLFTK